MNPIKQLFSAISGNSISAPPLPANHAARELLSPISAALPCGDSLEYDTEFVVLQARLEPKPEVQYGKFQSKPEGPDWAEIERDARRLLLRSKDISMLLWFTRARCRMAGAKGLLEGMATLQALLQAHPEHIHPQLVLDGARDPAVRANALAALCDPEGLLGDLREMVVTGNTAHRLTVRDVERAFAIPRPPYAPDPDAVKRQLADLHAKADTTMLALLACGDCARAIDQWSHQTLQDDAPNLAPLLKLLATLASFADAPERAVKVQAEAMEQHSGPHMLRNTELTDSNPVLQGQGSRGAQTLATLADGANPLPHHASVAQEREQIRALLRQVRLWIEHHEPSSPVTILIKQADRMWGKRFSEVAQMIPPDLMQAWDRDD